MKVSKTAWMTFVLTAVAGAGIFIVPAEKQERVIGLFLFAIAVSACHIWHDNRRGGEGVS
jgi:hypothetical protein